MRLLAGVRYLELSGRAPAAFAGWDEFRETLAAERDFVGRFMAAQRIQTNEVRRSWFLLPAFLSLARAARAETFDLVELGSSAGFNLVWDRYRYRYAAGAWGREDAPLELAGEERRPVPGELLSFRPVVRGRVGIDISPLDVTSDDDLLLLKSFVWVGQEDRLERIDRAAAALRVDPPELVRGDYVELLPELLTGRSDGPLTLVFQTASTGYLKGEQRRYLYGALDEAARDQPLGWVSTVPPADPGVRAFAVEAAVLPGERRRLMHADFHGSWLAWGV